jgi:hypothetical protein
MARCVLTIVSQCPDKVLAGLPCAYRRLGYNHVHAWMHMVDDIIDKLKFNKFHPAVLHLPFFGFIVCHRLRFTFSFRLNP